MPFIQFWLNINAKMDLGPVLLTPLVPLGALSSGDIWFELEKSSKSQCALVSHMFHISEIFGFYSYICMFFIPLLQPSYFALRHCNTGCGVFKGGI
jgi:hypothetical protein